jgi:hypothetical protein
MLRRYLGLARAFSASALLALTSLQGISRADEPAEASGAVPILQAQRQGLLSVDLRGHGEDQVQVQLRNTSERRLNVVIPPGLVAAAGTSQGGGGFQSMGLGTPSRTPGSFGAFRGAGSGSGFQSVPVEGTDPDSTIAVPAGQTVTLNLPSVCLNFGIPTPTARDRFRLVEVEEYTSDPRARKALRSLATLGTSQKVAQAVAWHAFNGMSLEQMALQARKHLNPVELTVAARFVQALDASGPSELVEPAYFQQGRIFLRIHGEGALAKDAARLASELEAQDLLGLPIRVVTDLPGEEAGPSAILLNVGLTSSTAESTRGRIQVGYRALDGSWQPLGQPAFQASRAASELDGASLAAALDRSIALNFVSTRVVRKGNGTTTLRLDSRLPMTIASADLRTGKDQDAGSVHLGALGLGPGRSTQVVIPAANGVVERVVLNGL